MTCVQCCCLIPGDACFTIGVTCNKIVDLKFHRHRTWREGDLMLFSLYKMNLNLKKEQAKLNVFNLLKE